MTSKPSRVVSTRLPPEAVKRLSALAIDCGQTTGSLARVLLTTALLNSQDPSIVLRKVAKVLGLPPDATPEQIKSAMDQLFGDAGADENADPAQDAAESPTQRLSLDRTMASMRKYYGDPVRLSVDTPLGPVEASGNYQPTPEDQTRMKGMSPVQQEHYLANREARAAAAASNKAARAANVARQQEIENRNRAAAKKRNAK